MPDFLSVTLNALLVAGLYATMSYGLALIYGVMKIINLAHAGVMMIAAYVTFSLFSNLHMDPFASILVVFPLFFAGGALLYQGVVKRLPASSGGPSIQSLLLLFGLWLVLQNMAYLIWTGDDRTILTSYTLSVINLPGGLSMAVPRLVTFVVGVASLLVLHFVLQRTYLGKAIRAVSQNRSSAMLVGINAQRVSAVAFGLGTAFAGLAGSLMAVLFAFNPDFGRGLLLKSFCIIVLGGMESFTGVAVGALVVALVESFATLYIGNIFQDAITFGLLVVALVIMPGGLAGLWSQLGQRRERGVAR